ncbi:hypothetical protein OPV22_018326 [Ensete ventricosum]|uniref:Uncharacterized protein n=1 Tax=Ensete ventricosum TaxID=4639 RepID=A0AAV8PIV5_ENSVE|nr:hypothetical protein OPV22_018326 [Ensete ventricosum]
MQDLGSSGPGLLAITEVPEAPDLRWLILPFARKLALLGRKDRARVLKEHGLGSDVPLKNYDRNVSGIDIDEPAWEAAERDCSNRKLKAAMEHAIESTDEDKK